MAETLEQLWVSYNQISSLSGIEKLSGLQVLFMSNNKIDKWSEVERLTALPKLRDLLLHGNPITDQFKDNNEGWRLEVLKRLPNLKVHRAPRACESPPGWLRPPRAATARTGGGGARRARCGLTLHRPTAQTLDGMLGDDDERERARHGD